MKRITLVGACLWLLALPATAVEPVTTEILYLSSSSVYIGMGSVDGLTAESVIEVLRDGEALGRLQVSYLAEHSASCKIVLAGGAFAVGDAVRFTPVLQTPVDLPPERPLVLKPWQGKALELPAREPAAELRGRASLEWKMLKDAGDTGQDLQQPALALKLDARRLWNRPVDFRLRLRSKYSQRSRAIDGSTESETAWLHRLYEASLVWHGENKPFSLALGRLYSRDIPGAGNWDGLQLDWRPGEKWRLGAFGGGMPGLTDSAPNFDAKKLGAYLAYEQGDVGLRGFRGSLGAVGEYADGEVSREFLASRASLWLGPVTMFAGAELDINRDWREEAAGESSTLSRLNATLRYGTGRLLQVHLGYDRYVGVRQALTREIPDSLWRDLRQSGLRAGADLRLPWMIRLGGHVGIRDRDDRQDGEIRPLFAGAYLGLSDLLDSGVDLQCRYAFADGRYTRSHVPSVDLQRAFGPKLRLGLGVGIQSYEGTASESELGTMEGQWLRVTCDYRITRALDLQGLYAYNQGDILDGSQVLMRLGYRF